MQNTSEPADSDWRPDYRSNALARGLSLLLAVAQAESPPTLAELNGLTGQPKPTLVRLLAVLEAESFVVRVDDRPSYALGNATIPIALAYFSHGTPVDVLRGPIRALAKATTFTANLGMMVGNLVTHVCVEFPDRALRLMAVEGELAEGYSSGLGKAMLAFQDEVSLRAMLPAEAYESKTPTTITTFARLGADLAATRERGYAIDDEESIPGVRCLAVPIRSGSQVIAALSVSAPAGELPLGAQDALAARVTEAVGEIVGSRGQLEALNLVSRMIQSGAPLS